MNLYRYIPTFYSWWWHLTRCRRCNGLGFVTCGMCNGSGVYPADYMCGHCHLAQGRVQCPKCKGWAPDDSVQLFDANGKYLMTLAVAHGCQEVRLPVLEGFGEVYWRPEDADHAELDPLPISERIFRRVGETSNFKEVEQP